MTRTIARVIDSDNVAVLPIKVQRESVAHWPGPPPQSELPGDEFHAASGFIAFFRRNLLC